LKKLLFLALVLALGCHHTKTPSNPLTPQEAAGQQLFVSRCSSCHYADSADGLYGPGLQGLLRKPYLPSGRVANDKSVTGVILRGWGMMPPLGNTLTDQQLQDLLAYLHTL
jgi:mono/diheme cytochrome c family protein